MSRSNLKNIYCFVLISKFFFSVRFWLTILDPVINGTGNKTGTVTLNDSSGKNVHTWDEIKFDESIRQV